VEAQGVASSFDQLNVLVKPGDKITVVDLAGREAEGRIGMLSRDRLTLVTPAGPRELGEVDVAQIRQRRGDPLQNGAIIGAAAGAGYGLALLAIVVSADDGGGPIPAGVVIGMVVFTGVGAAAGAGIDALITRRQVIYRKPPGESRLSVVPLFGRGRRGVAVTLKFGGFPPSRPTGCRASPTCGSTGSRSPW
jgi:hypothetical protein